MTAGKIDRALHSAKIWFLLLFFPMSLTFLLFQGNAGITATGEPLLPLSGKVIVVDPGHGGDDPGVWDKEDDIKEKDINLTVAMRLKEELVREGAEVIMTRETDRDYILPFEKRQGKSRKRCDLDKRIEIARKARGNILVSIHVNSTTRSDYGGAEVFYLPQSSVAKLLAGDIQDELRLIPGMVKRIPKTGNYYILNQVTMPAVIVELGFVTYRPEKEKLLMESYQSQLAKSISRGIVSYFLQKHDSEKQDPEQKNTLQLKWKISVGKITSFLNRKNYVDALRDKIFEAIGQKAETSGESLMDQFFLKYEPTHKLSFPDLHLGGGYHTNEESILKSKKPKAAIVIDDLGASKLSEIESLFQLKIPLTLAVLPYSTVSKRICQEANDHGYQVILHMPMEAHKMNLSWLGPDPILLRLSDNEIEQRFLDALERVPGVIGFNNHMGSLVTEDYRVVKQILETAAQRKLFVLDSRTTINSVIPKVAAEIGVPYAERTVFLDGTENTGQVERQLHLLAEEANKKGVAVGIGHVGAESRGTIEVLKKAASIMKSEGVTLVFLSEIVK